MCNSVRILSQEFAALSREKVGLRASLVCVCGGWGAGRVHQQPRNTKWSAVDTGGPAQRRCIWNVMSIQVTVPAPETQGPMTVSLKAVTLGATLP